MWPHPQDIRNLVILFPGQQGKDSADNSEGYRSAVTGQYARASTGLANY